MQISLKMVALKRLHLNCCTPMSLFLIYRFPLVLQAMKQAFCAAALILFGGSAVCPAQAETSVKGLYMVGVASANSFGPMMRFAYGAGFTAKRISKDLAAQARATRLRQPSAASVGLAID